MSDPFQQFSQYASKGQARVVETWRLAARQPSWVTRAAIVAFILIFALPILLLAMVAIIAAAAVFLALTGIYVLYARARGLFVGDGRKNVRVIVRRE